MAREKKKEEESSSSRSSSSRNGNKIELATPADAYRMYMYKVRLLFFVCLFVVTNTRVNR